MRVKQYCKLECVKEGGGVVCLQYRQVGGENNGGTEANTVVSHSQRGNAEAQAAAMTLQRQRREDVLASLYRIERAEGQE